MEDVPCGLPESVLSLITEGWTVNKARRPSAAELLQHDVFRLLGRSAFLSLTDVRSFILRNFLVVFPPCSVCLCVMLPMLLFVSIRARTAVRVVVDGLGGLQRESC